jgi:ATP-dependent DNA helicase RecG
MLIVFFNVVFIFEYPSVNLVEREDGILIFVNSGAFIPGCVEKVVAVDAPETYYRNPFLASAMVGLGMIDTIGSGIKKMFVLQKDKFFPLPSKVNSLFDCASLRA